MAVKSICGVILASETPEELAGFYAEVLDLAFEREEHGDLETHFGVDIGEVHFGIHPPGNVGVKGVGAGSTCIAFNVDSLQAVSDRIGRLGGKEVSAPHDEGFGLVASFLDPEGNPFEVVELDYEFGA